MTVVMGTPWPTMVEVWMETAEVLRKKEGEMSVAF